MLATQFVVNYELNIKGIKEPGCEKLSMWFLIHLELTWLVDIYDIDVWTDMYAPFAASNTVDFQHYCYKTVTTDTVISCLNAWKRKIMLFNRKLVENITKCTPRAMGALVSHHNR